LPPGRRRGRVARHRPDRYSCGKLIYRRLFDMAKKAKPAAAPQSGRAIITIIGSDRVGIIAGIANVLAEANVNILDISQSVIREFFTMIMMVDLAGSAISFHALREKLQRKGLELAVRVEIQREEIFKAMHRV
jgi:ACT domain-containing protein